MEESSGAQYALQIALQTLRERCQQFQQRVINLEEENLSLRNKLDNFVGENTDSLTEIIKLKQQVTQLMDQKTQLSNNFQMVSTENRRLWARLSNVTQVNDNNVVSTLNEVNIGLLQQGTDNVPQGIHTTLTRSKTFTQDEPRMKIHKSNIIDENEKLSLELQEISLKLLNTIAQEKLEVESQYCQINEIENANTMFINSFAFPNTSETIETTVLDEFDEQLTKLKSIKENLLLEKIKLQSNYSNLTNIKSKCKSTTSKEFNIETNSVSIQTCDDDDDELARLAKWATPDNSNNFIEKLPNSNTDAEKICPLCTKVFPNSTKFINFQNHVQSHFMTEINF